MGSAMNQLLTPEDVAEVLQISLSTVYKNAMRLGGFYPFGLKVLRFQREVIERGHLEEQRPGGLVVQLPASGEAIRGKGVPEKIGGPFRPGRSKKASQGGCKDPNRHGLLDGIKRLS